MTMYGTSTPLNAHLDAATADMFGASPFSGHKRRKRGDAVARWTTKAVLLSPLLILSLWSLIVIFSGTKTLQQTPSAGAVRIPVRPHSKQAVRVPVRPHHKGVRSQFATQEMFMNSQQGSQAIVQPPNLGAVTDGRTVRARPHPKSILDGKLIPLYVPLGETQGQQVQQDVMANTQASNAMRSNQQGEQEAAELANSQSNMNAMMNSNAMMNTQNAGSMMNSNAMMNSNGMTSTQTAGSMMNSNIKQEPFM